MRFINRRGIYNLVQAILIPMLMHSTALTGQADGIIVRGKVYSAETGLPLAEISIRAVNSTVEPASSNAEGAFEITLPDGNEQILFSYPGYKEKTIFINGREIVDVWLLRENERSLSDAVGMSFRNMPIRDLTGALDAGSTIDFSKSPNSSFCQDLQGKMGGLTVINRSGILIIILILHSPCCGRWNDHTVGRIRKPDNKGIPSQSPGGH
jgi:hypothetical protein